MTTEQELDALRASLSGEEKGSPTLSEMNALAETLAQRRDEKTALEETLSALNAQVKDIEQQIVALMMANELKSYKAPAGMVSVRQIFSAPLPKGPDKILFFDYLKNQGRFDELASVHSKTYESFVKEAYELARERGESEPSLPGVLNVKTLLGISFRRSKNGDSTSESN